MSDAALYDTYAQAWSENRGLEQWGTYLKHPLGSFTYRPPGYPLFLGTIYYLFGHSYVKARRIQAIFSALTCVLIGLIATKIFNMKTGFMSALIAALYQPFIQLSTRLLTETLFMFLLYVFVLCALHMVEKPNIKRIVICGMLLGLTSITRPVVVPLIPMFFVWLYFSGAFGRKYLIFSGVLFMSILTILLPIVVKNYQIHKKFIPVSTNGGLMFYLGFVNTPDLKNKGILLSKEEIRSMGLTEIDEEKFFYHVGLNYLKKYPSEVPKIIQSKIKRLFYTFKGERPFRPFRFKVDRLGTNQHQNAWYCILVTSIFGIVFFMKKRIAEIRNNNHSEQIRLTQSSHAVQLLFLIVFAQMATLFIYDTHFRYRYPFEPVFMMFSAYCLVYVWNVAKHYYMRCRDRKGIFGNR